jgi:hypothetical protein
MHPDRKFLLVQRAWVVRILLRSWVVPFFERSWVVRVFPRFVGGPPARTMTALLMKTRARHGARRRTIHVFAVCVGGLGCSAFVGGPPARTMTALLLKTRARRAAWGRAIHAHFDFAVHAQTR